MLSTGAIINSQLFLPARFVLAISSASAAGSQQYSLPTLSDTNFAHRPLPQPISIPTDSFGISLRKGSLIIVDPEEICRDGDLILMKIKEDNSLVVKQFLKEGNECYIKSVNPEIKGLKLLTDETEIIGIIIETRFNLQEKVKDSTQYKPDPLFNLDPIRAKT